METYDIVMLVVLVGTALFGAIKGFAWQLASIASIVVSYVVAFNFREQLSQSIQADPPWNRFLAMLILFIGTSLVIWVAFRMVSNTIDRMRLKEFDRQIGALFGLAKGGLYCILVTLFGVTLLGETVREKIVASKSGRYIASVLDRSEALIPEEIHEVVGPYLERFDKKFNDGADSSALPWLRAATEEAIPDSYWDSQNTAGGARLPIDPRGWLPPQDAAPSYSPQPSGQPSGFQPPRFQQAERPSGGAF
ncbi:MAG TPA: colicin V production protein [Planctomycetaceae bacterium]|nr:colicin V production protein [Planctomycetaceae bacterium]